MTNNKKGFTLIELLVVIAIIGILSAIGLVSLNGAREKARDAQRKSDLAQYKSALVLFYDDNTNHYPAVAVANTSELVTASLNTAVTGAGKYLGSALQDPVNATKTGTGAGDYRYYYVSDGASVATSNTYGLFVDLEGNGATKVYHMSLNGAVESVRDADGYNCDASASKLDVCD